MEDIKRELTAIREVFAQDKFWNELERLAASALAAVDKADVGRVKRSVDALLRSMPQQGLFSEQRRTLESVRASLPRMTEPVFDQAECTVTIPVDDVRPASVEVDFRKDALSVLVSGQTLVDGRLFDTVDVDGCMWSLDTTPDGEKALVLNLDKAQPSLEWKTLLADGRIPASDLKPVSDLEAFVSQSGVLEGTGLEQLRQ